MTETTLNGPQDSTSNGGAELTPEMALIVNRPHPAHPNLYGSGMEVVPFSGRGMDVVASASPIEPAGPQRGGQALGAPAQGAAQQQLQSASEAVSHERRQYAPRRLKHTAVVAIAAFFGSSARDAAVSRVRNGRRWRDFGAAALKRTPQPVVDIFGRTNDTAIALATSAHHGYEGMQKWADWAQYGSLKQRLGAAAILHTTDTISNTARWARTAVLEHPLGQSYVIRSMQHRISSTIPGPWSATTHRDRGNITGVWGYPSVDQ